MSTTKPYSDNFSGPEVKPLRVEFDVLSADNLARLKILVNAELQRTDCTVRLAGGVSGMSYPNPPDPFPAFMFSQALTRYYL